MMDTPNSANVSCNAIISLHLSINTFASIKQGCFKLEIGEGNSSRMTSPGSQSQTGEYSAPLTVSEVSGYFHSVMTRPRWMSLAKCSYSDASTITEKVNRHFNWSLRNWDQLNCKYGQQKLNLAGKYLHHPVFDFDDKGHFGPWYYLGPKWKYVKNVNMWKIYNGKKNSVNLCWKYIKINWFSALDNSSWVHTECCLS